VKTITLVQVKNVVFASVASSIGGIIIGVGASISLMIGGNLFTYGESPRAQTAGIEVTLPLNHWCGYEYRGTPGFFCDVN
jgi:hypothetical protein